MAVLDGERRGAAVVIGLAWAGFTAVNLFWPGGLFFYVPPHACALALLALDLRVVQGRAGPRTRSKKASKAAGRTGHPW